jgi:hypothetical protein
VATNHLATVAAWLHRRSHLHLETPHLWARHLLLASIGVNSPPCRTLEATVSSLSH